MAKKIFFKLNPKRHSKRVRVNKQTITEGMFVEGKKWEPFAIARGSVYPLLVEVDAKEVKKLSKEQKERDAETKDAEPVSVEANVDNKEDSIKETDEVKPGPSRDEMVEVFSGLSGIGKVSAAKIYDSGIHTLSDMVDADPEDISKTVGRFFSKDRAEVAINDARDMLLHSPADGEQL